MDPFKEYIVAQMDLKRPCTIKFRTIDGGVTTLKAHIVDLSTVSDRDILETDAGLHIGLDQIIQVNDRVADNYC